MVHVSSIILIVSFFQRIAHRNEEEVNLITFSILVARMRKTESGTHAKITRAIDCLSELFHELWNQRAIRVHCQ